jgi:hypothetical protein
VQALTTLVPDGSDCVHATAGSFLVFARSTTDSGLPSSVPIAGTFAVRLANAPSKLQLAIGATVLDEIAWTTTPSPGIPLVVDSDGTRCWAPAGTPTYLFNNQGTPGATNFGECP